MLELHVTDTEDRALDGIAMSLAGPEAVVKTVRGGVILPLPPRVGPGARVKLNVHHDKWVLISPWNGEIQVPVEGSGPVSVILGRRGDKQTLASGDALGAIIRRIDAGIAVAKRDSETITDAERRRVLDEQARELGFTPQEVDETLRQLKDRPVSLDEKRLLNRYFEHFPNPIVIGTLIINQARAEFTIDGQLDMLGLGGHAVLVVQGTPREALAGARCTWTFEPADVLQVTGAPGACRIDVAMPAAPLASRGSMTPVRVTARIEKDGTLLDEIGLRGKLHNGVRIDVVVGALGITPDAPVRVSVVRHGGSDPIPLGLTCTWNLSGSTLLVFKPLTPNGCEGTFAYAPESEWDAKDGIRYSFELQMKSDLTIPVRLQHGKATLYGSESVVTFTQLDQRDPAELRATFEQRYAAELRSPSAKGAELDAVVDAGLPPLKELNAKTVALGLLRDRNRWQLVTRYVGPQPTELKGPLNEYAGLVKVLYSTDGNRYQRSDLDFASGDQTIEDLAEVKEMWVKFEASGRATEGFKLPFDFDSAVRAELVRAWQDMDPSYKESIACRVLVEEPGRIGISGDHHEFLAAIDEISVARDEKAVWRTRRYDAKLEHLYEKNFEKLSSPVGPTGYVTRIRFRGGVVDTVSCAGTAVQKPNHPGGRYYRLARTMKKAAGWPDELEVFLSGKWQVAYVADLPYTAVRFSTDGKSFRTATGGQSISFDDPAENWLALRFVAEEGQEIEYGGAIDFGENRFSMLRAQVFDDGKFECWTGDDSPVICGFTRQKPAYYQGRPVSIEVALPVLRSVAFGCSRDRLEYRDGFENVRSASKRDRDEALSFSVPRKCETVFARFTLANGTETALLVAPVSTEGR